MQGVISPVNADLKGSWFEQSANRAYHQYRQSQKFNAKNKDLTIGTNTTGDSKV